jgi:RNA polymerase sigma-70 factor (ECF subfamily)
MLAGVFCIANGQAGRDHDSLCSAKKSRGRVSAEPEISEAQVATDLVSRINNGDRVAEGALVSRYRPRLLYALARLVEDFSYAEDAANEALLIAIAKLRSAPIETPARLGGYLFGIAKNVLRNERRKSSKESGFDPELLDLIASTSLNQVELLEQRELGIVVRQVMDSVTNQRYREVLVRFYLQQEDKEQICNAMQLSRRDFTQVISRARESFRKVVRAKDV